MEAEHRAPSREAGTRWLERLTDLARQWHAPPDRAAKETVLAELWSLLNLVMQVQVRAAARRLGRIDEDDVLDVAADKTLDLVRRIDDGRWQPEAAGADHLRGFLATVARNGVVDVLRLRGREVSGFDADGVDAVRKPTALDPGALGTEYARTLVRCLRGLTERARWVWLLRVIHEVPSAEVGRHPDVGMSAGGVDMLLSRTRRHIEACMESHGLDPRVAPGGTFVALWEILDDVRPSAARPRGGSR